MYINIKNLFKIDPTILPLLLVAKQAGKKELSTEIAMLLPEDDITDKLIEDGYLKLLKGKANQELPEKIRLGKKGTEFLNSLDQPDVEEEDIKVFIWLSDVYKKRNKQIGNGKNTKRLIASFREKSGIEKNELAFLCKTFIDDEEQQEWSFKLEYVFWKPKNLFQTKFVLEDSRLWTYYNKRKTYFDKAFKNLK